MLRHGMTTEEDMMVASRGRRSGTNYGVLMIACAFPPTSGSGVQRPAKFAKYLHRLGWRVHVWCGKELPRLPRDASLLGDIPDEVHVDGLRVWNVPTWMAEWCYPDERIEWIVRSLPRLVRLVRRKRPDVIWSTYSPASNHLLGWALSRATGLPWVADFRDLWTVDCAYAETSWWRRRLDVRLERFLVRAADAVVAVSDAQRDILAALALDAADRFFTITNGVDIEDWTVRSEGAPFEPTADRPRDRRQERLVIAHVGRLEARRFTPEHIAGFQRFAERHAADLRDIELRFVGQSNSTVIDALVRARFLTHQTGHVDHATAVAEMRKADVLLLPGAQGRNADSLIPGKTFEYLASGRPIWLIAPASSEVWRRIAPLGSVLRCDARADAIAATLASIVGTWRRGDLPDGRSMEALMPYTRARLADRLSDILTWIVRRRTPRRHPKKFTASSRNGYT